MTRLSLLIGSLTLMLFSGACSLSDSAIRSRVVMLQSDVGLCTGEQVRGKSGKKYILTAGHCVALGKTIIAFTEDGRAQTVRLVYEAHYSDLALYTPVKDLEPFLLRPAHRHQSVRIFSHGQGHATFTASGEMLEELLTDITLETPPPGGCSMPKYRPVFVFGPTCSLHTLQQVTTAWAVPGSSGGPAVDYQGYLIGVVSGGNDRFTFLVPPKAIYDLLKRF